ncbi:GumC family protein [Limoniibacter endophyticus]|uniref:Succinoglycan biosynthesis protein exop n=1 Tax=Limoniibacter endophyticus TaxID=1565040 RepID=A0A8J3DNE2_9HYPH|nr:GumC family protein [Limoniibacter endophyticus]GHC67628.1 hypothetical protein GCM10010136_11840 [Limoniibacter endophyticus]
MADRSEFGSYARPGSILDLDPALKKNAAHTPAASDADVVASSDLTDEKPETTRDLVARIRASSKEQVAPTETLEKRPGLLKRFFTRRDAGEEAAPVATAPAAVTAHQSEREITRFEVPRDQSRHDPQGWNPLIDPVDVVMGVIRSPLIIALFTILGAVAGVFIALSTPKLYESVTELLVDPRNILIVERDLTQSQLPSDATLAVVENQVRVLTSSIVLNKVVDTLSLDEDPEFNGRGSNSLSIRGLIEDLVSTTTGQSNEDRRHALAVEGLAKAISVARGDRTFVVTINARTQNPEKSALIANTMAEVFLDTTGELQQSTARRANREIEARLGELRQTTEDAERAVEQYKAANDLVDAQGRLITDDEIVRLNEQLTNARARALELAARAESAQGASIDDVLGGTLPEQVSSNVLGELRAQYSSVQQEVDRLAIRLGPRHPQRQGAEAQLAGIRSQIQNELRRTAGTLNIESRRAQALQEQLQARLDELKERQTRVSSELVHLRELERDASAKRSVYEAYLLRSRETTEQQDLNTTNISIISPAYPPLQPTGPSRSTIAAALTMVGLLVGIGIGILRGAWASFRRHRDGRPDPGGGARARHEERGSEMAVIGDDNRTAIIRRDRSGPDAALERRGDRSEFAAAGDETGEDERIEELRSRLRNLREAVEDYRDNADRERFRH